MYAKFSEDSFCGSKKKAKNIITVYDRQKQIAIGYMSDWSDLKRLLDLTFKIYAKLRKKTANLFLSGGGGMRGWILDMGLESGVLLRVWWFDIAKQILVNGEGAITPNIFYKHVSHSINLKYVVIVDVINQFKVCCNCTCNDKIMFPFSLKNLPKISNLQSSLYA